MTFQEAWEKQPMSKPRIEKVTVNMGVGESGDRLLIGAKVMEELTEEVKKKIKLVFIDRIEDVFELALYPEEKKEKRSKRTRRVPNGMV